jgi:LmbE family N-acetylglucosaminyl deacetylase
MELKRGDIKKGDYRYVYYSPHLDDVVFSCGGRIAGHREGRALVVTAFAGLGDPAGTFGPQFSAFLDMKGRRGEDVRATSMLGADHLWLDFNEAFQRDKKYTSLTGLLSQTAKSDLTLSETLFDIVRDITEKTGAAKLFFPLGVGNHVDHRILFRLGRRLSLNKRWTGEVLFYEDIAYALIPHLVKTRLQRILGAAMAAIPTAYFGPASSVFGEAAQTYSSLTGMKFIRDNLNAVTKLLFYGYILEQSFVHRHIYARKKRTPVRASPDVVDISDHIQAKLDAAREYESQVSLIFGNMESFRDALTTHSAAITGRPGSYVERCWRFEPGTEWTVPRQHPADPQLR